MKIRLGYVSNSSSSSFVVRLKKGFVITPESIHFLMFNTDVDHQVECYGDPFSSHELAEVVANDLLQVNASNQEAIAGEIAQIRGNEPNYDDFEMPTSAKDTGTRYWNTDHKAKEKANVLHKNHELKIYQNEYKEFDNYVLSYGDENGSRESLLEHGGYLENFADRISHH